MVPPTLLVEDRLELELGGRRLVLEAEPTAHTDNDLCVLDARTGTLWLADLLFMERVPVIDGSLLGWLDVLAALRARPAARVVPGHGPVSAPGPPPRRPIERYLDRPARRDPGAAGRRRHARAGDSDRRPGRARPVAAVRLLPPAQRHRRLHRARVGVAARGLLPGFSRGRRGRAPSAGAGARC